MLCRVSPHCLALLVQLATAQTWVQTQSVDFWNNHTITDRVWFYRNPDGTPGPPGGTYPPIEYILDAPYGNPLALAFSKAVHPVFEVRFKNVWHSPVSGYFKVFATYDSWYSLPFFSTWSPNIPFTLQPGETRAATTQLLAPLPDQIDNGMLQFHIKYYSDSQIEIGDTGLLFEIYVTNSAPVSSTAFLETQWVPWIEMLRVATKAAADAQGTHNALQRCADEVRFFFFQYDLAREGYPRNYTFFYNMYNLTGLWSSSGLKVGNCDDIAFFTALLVASLGYNCSVEDVSTLNQPYPHPVYAQMFVTNNVKMAGYFNYQKVIFGRHAIVIMDEKAYDGSLLVHPNQTWNPDNLPFGTYSIPVTNYWQTPDFKGLVWRYAHYPSEEVSWDQGFMVTLDPQYTVGEEVPLRRLQMRLKGVW